MNDFIIINVKKNNLDSTGVEIQLNSDWILVTESNYETFTSQSRKIFVFGDYIGEGPEILETPLDDIPKLRGNFYALVVLKNSIKVYSSFLNMLPIYMTKDQSLISSSIIGVLKNSDQPFTLDKKYILENLLFNYGFFNRTKYNEIKLVPSNSHVSIETESLFIHSHYSISKLFSSSQNSTNNSANELSDYFIGTIHHYFPDEPFEIAFTSGFDGRTIVSCALHYNKQFSTFSFGRKENDDVAIPMKNADELHMPYDHFDLSDANYIQDDFIKNAQEYNSTGYLGNGFLYAHFPYSAKKIMNRSKYLLSGACGSELFRALHSTGAVTSVALADVFRIENSEELREKLINAKVFEVLKKEEFKQELAELVEEIISYKEQLPQGITENQRFYVFVFEEIFRKFFGQWIAVQQKYIKVRTPFLDFKFIKSLLQTNFAGANNDFFTSNPFKRIKGQYIYADIIRKTNKTIYRQHTGKGYRPLDVRNIFYSGNIVFPFIKKKFTKKVSKPYLDNLGIISGVKENQVALEETISNSSFFNKRVLYEMLRELSPFTPEKERDTLLMSISLLTDVKNKVVKNKVIELEQIDP